MLYIVSSCSCIIRSIRSIRGFFLSHAEITEIRRKFRRAKQRFPLFHSFDYRLPLSRLGIVQASLALRLLLHRFVQFVVFIRARLEVLALGLVVVHIPAAFAMHTDDGVVTVWLTAVDAIQTDG
jgi:hypothetical protein